MEILFPRCAGLDIGKDEVGACVRVTDGARPETQTRTFRTYAASLATLAEWLATERVTHVVMEGRAPAGSRSGTPSRRAVSSSCSSTPAT